MKRPLIMIFGGLFLLAVCAGLVDDMTSEALLFLAFGWARFLGRMFEELSPDWGNIVTALVCLIALPVVLHLFFRWLFAFLGRIGDPTRKLRWSAGWTAAIFAIIVLTFTAGIAATGIIHHSDWLAKTPERLASGIREASPPTRSKSSLKQMAIGVHSFHDQNKLIITGGTFDKLGIGLHGWQTQLLPYMEHYGLYKQIKFEQPWHAPANAVVFKIPVADYQYRFTDQLYDSAGFALSHYSSNVRIIGGGPPLSMKEIMEADGLANTLLIGEAAGNYKPWGHHANWRDPGLGINKSADGFGNPRLTGAHFAMADGSVHFLNDKVSPSVLKALSTPNGGEKINVADWDPP